MVELMGFFKVNDTQDGFVAAAPQRQRPAPSARRRETARASAGKPDKDDDDWEEF